MKKILPQTKSNPSGFTLIELLVVIAIIGILAVVGIALFSSTQNKARDSRRVQEINAMAKAMEVNYRPGIGYTSPMNNTWFADGSTPTNPTPNGANYHINYTNTTSFVFCALLENSTGNSTTSNAISGGSAGSYFCQKNSQ